MSHRDIVYKSKTIRLHKSYVTPMFNEPTVITGDQFKYVELWLKRKGPSKAQVYWNQARNFYEASRNLPDESKPLTSYYMMLNAAKALLRVKQKEVTEIHGAKGKVVGKLSLSNEEIKLLENGIIPGLFAYFEAPIHNKVTNLKAVLYNIPFVHRAFTITFRTAENLFIPIENPKFVRQNRGNEGWFCTKIKDAKYAKKHIFEKQRGWEIESEDNGFLIRRKGNRFRWHSKGPDSKNNIFSLIEYHKLIRRDIKYIYGAMRLWYFKRNDKQKDLLPWPTPGLIMLAMHRLSELCRYEPDRLARYLDSQYNWLLHEFLSLSNDNFIDTISCEITGEDLMVPTYRS
jgi:hypothetical protein